MVSAPAGSLCLYTCIVPSRQTPAPQLRVWSKNLKMITFITAICQQC